MSEILVATWDGGGNVPPAIHLVDELHRRGHTVRLLGHETQRDALASHAPFTAYDGARAFAAAEPQPLRRQLGVFSERALGVATTSALEREPADVVVADCMLLPVIAACTRAGVPVVSLEHLFDAYLRGPWSRGPVGAIARLRRLRPDRVWAGAALSLGATLPDLDPAAERQPDGLLYTGPLLDLPSRVPSLAARDPAVLVSLSGYAYPGMAAALQRILDATASLPARVVVTTGPVIDPDTLRTGPRHEVHRWVDHDELLPHVSLLVGHGGHATTMRALAHDLPMVLLPMHPMLDQPMVARAVADAGAGTALRKKEPAETIRAAVERLLADGPHRAAAARLGARLRSLGGTRLAADLVEQVGRRAGVPGSAEGIS